MKRKLTAIVTATSLALVAFATPAAFAHEGEEHGKEEPKKEEPAKKDPNQKPYKIDTCIVSDEKLGEMGKPVVFDYKGQEIKLCCKKCRKEFDKDPEKFIKKMEEKK